MSETEQALFTSSLHSHVGLEVDGVILDTKVEFAILSDVDLMIAGAGAIAISLTAATPGNGEHRITVSDSYIPAASSGAAITSTFEMNSTTDTAFRSMSVGRTIRRRVLPDNDIRTRRRQCLQRQCPACPGADRRVGGAVDYFRRLRDGPPASPRSTVQLAVAPDLGGE